MIQIKILNGEDEEIFSEKGTAIDVVYNGEYNQGDKIIISKTDSEYLQIRGLSFVRTYCKISLMFRFVWNKGGDAYGVNVLNNYFFHSTNN